MLNGHDGGWSGEESESGRAGSTNTGREAQAQPSPLRTSAQSARCPGEAMQRSVEQQSNVED